MILLKDLKSVLYRNEIVNVYKIEENSMCEYYGVIKDISQDFDDYQVCDIFINAYEELSIYIKKENVCFTNKNKYNVKKYLTKT
jgi:hypothetical protein